MEEEGISLYIADLVFGSQEKFGDEDNEALERIQYSTQALAQSKAQQVKALYNVDLATKYNSSTFNYELFYLNEL